MFVASVLLLFLELSKTMASGMDPTLQAFVQRAVPAGGIVFFGSVQTPETIYTLFVLEQEQRRGILVLATNSVSDSSNHEQVLFADTSLDFAWEHVLISREVLEQLTQLLASPGTLSQAQTMAASQDVYPIGAALNTVLGPIAGFTFRSNSTLGILHELEQSDAIPVSPNVAPIGSILVCPTTYSPSGPVSLGSVVIIGSDHKVYGPDIRQGSAWTCFGLLETWIEKYGANNQLFGFLLRARPE